MTTTRTNPDGPARPLRVAIVGAGFGGLATAIELKRHGVADFTVFERHEHVGGVWQANSYPGAACDVPSIIYQFSYAMNEDWKRRFGSQAEIRAYLDDVARRFGILDHVRFGTAVEGAAYDDDSGRWTVTLADGSSERFDVVACANGQLSRPKVPDVPGRETFAGAQFHSARWDHDVDLAGKRVAVVGSGASAVQIVPAIVDAAAHVTVIQRSANWIVNKYDWAPSRLEQVLLTRIPPLMQLYHLAMWWWFEARVPLIYRWIDPLRRLWEAHLRRGIRRKVGDPAKAAAVTPDYALGCNRVLLSSQWYPTIARDDVSVVASGVERVTESGLIAGDGTVVDADVIVWSTGFTPTEYLAPMRISGRDGRDLHRQWRDGPEAYLGLATPGFPNLFMVYGPNTGSLTNTIIFLLERQAAYIRQAVEHLRAADVASVEVREDVHRRFNERVQARLRKTVFTTGCPGWYATESGKVTQVWPGSHVAYARATARFRAEDYHQRPAVAAAREPVAG